MKTTTELEGEESKSREGILPAEEETLPPEDFPDPNFTIEASGGPSDDGGRPHTGPPPKN